MSVTPRSSSLRFSFSSQRKVDDDFDHLIILQDNTQPEQPVLSEATTYHLTDVLSPNTSAILSRVQSYSSNTAAGITASNGANANADSEPPSPGGSLTTGGFKGHRRSASLRKHLAERKYHRYWQQDEDDAAAADAADSTTDNEGGSESEGRASQDGKKAKKVNSRSKGKAKDFPSAVLAKQEAMSKKGHKAIRKAYEVGRRIRKEEIVEDAGELDILYENQRGYFFFGVPHFSNRSLLPLDSSSWTNRYHHPSPVNIFTAQVPDPTWKWAWKAFAVDMTGDVDEEGWQYSFAFRGSKWHGNAVWWHGFVRRRRWIRKRVKRRLPTRDEEEDSHHLAPEYFTIHSKRGSLVPEVGGYMYPGSPESGSLHSPGSKSSKLDDYPSAIAYSSDSEMEEPDIRDIPSLMRAFKKARVDREKIEALSSFLENGGEEVVYLVDNMEYIMHSMIFQQSRRKVLQILLQTQLKAQAKLQAFQSNRDKQPDQSKGKEKETETEENPPAQTLHPAPTFTLTPPDEQSDPTANFPYKSTNVPSTTTLLAPQPPTPTAHTEEYYTRYLSGLTAAVDAGEAEVRKLEFWSDIKKTQDVGYSGVDNSKRVSTASSASSAAPNINNPRNSNDNSNNTNLTEEKEEKSLTDDESSPQHDIWKVRRRKSAKLRGSYDGAEEEDGDDERESESTARITLDKGKGRAEE